MKCGSDIVTLADSRLKEADYLLQQGMWDGAYYLAGYSVELLLKARVCKTLGIDDFFEFNKAKKELYRPYKVHDYQELIILSGLYPELVKAQADITFKANWSLICNWGEESRYLTGKQEKEVREFVSSLIEISKWIKGLL